MYISRNGCLPSAKVLIGSQLAAPTVVVSVRPSRNEANAERTMIHCMTVFCLKRTIGSSRISRLFGLRRGRRIKTQLSVRAGGFRWGKRTEADYHARRG